ncbi:hypothetical protein [Polaribacter sejongensis]|uniref:hypothetical protein n=1 Tax=Polaribacter sejongensis TaxID=985043 RepID=UPI001AD8233A|nr:hypothetical protein [Polaribacter sejongensis]
MLFVCILLFAHCCGYEVRDTRIAALRFFRTLCRACYWSPAEKGADILYDLVTSKTYKDDSGKYFDNDKGDPKGYFSQAYPDAYDGAKIEKLLVLTDSLF